MANDEKPVPPIMFAEGTAYVQLSPEDALAFQDWQRLDKKEKAALIWLAKHHPSAVRLIKAEIWIGQTASFLVRLGMGATALMAVAALVSYVLRRGG